MFDNSNIEGRSYFNSKLEAAVYLGKDVMVLGSKGSWSHCILNKDAKDIDDYIHSGFKILYSPGPKAGKWCYPQLGCGFSCPVEYNLDNSLNHVWKIVFLVSLDVVKLTVD